MRDTGNPAPYPQLLHVDARLLAVDKPAGLLSVPGRGEDKADCVLARLRLVYPEALAVHRLDQVTSGVMVFARDAASHRALSVAFQHCKVWKTYEAIVEGEVDGDAGEVDAPMRCDWPNRPRQMVDLVDGKPALTRWRVLARDPAGAWTRLALHPHTGRSHQLRVHMCALGHPIVGDVFYGAGPAARVHLHASRLELAHPRSGKPLAFAAAVPF